MCAIVRTTVSATAIQLSHSKKGVALPMRRRKNEMNLLLRMVLRFPC
jgi:hypothetical protein